MPIARPRRTLWCLVATQKSHQQMADAFNRTHHGLRIEVTAVPDDQFVTKIATAIRSGNVADAVDLDDVNATLLAYRDALTDLTDHVRALTSSPSPPPSSSPHVPAQGP
ncbi:extracellular solute-binding protein [Streptomyces sp. NPDC051896]|uniref:extracellular solute-binding protein n=1 Tax=Streptomyces sp. NPDC051896 TaxID=3155416 RepID=UPI0034345740